MICGLIHSGLVAPCGNISLSLLSLRSCWSVKFVRRLRFDNYFHISMMTSSNGSIFPVTGPLPFMRGIHRSPVNPPHKGQRHGALMFSLIWAWINARVNNREAGDLGRYCAHYDVIVMSHSPMRPAMYYSRHWYYIEIVIQRTCGKITWQITYINNAPHALLVLLNMIKRV